MIAKIIGMGAILAVAIGGCDSEPRSHNDNMPDFSSCSTDEQCWKTWYDFAARDIEQFSVEFPNYSKTVNRYTADRIIMDPSRFAQYPWLIKRVTWTEDDLQLLARSMEGTDVALGYDELSDGTSYAYKVAANRRNGSREVLKQISGQEFQSTAQALAWIKARFSGTEH